ncbi:acyl-CoA dehydrogenase family protein [Kitasatospora sp. NPDC036755]|uniref:acyl-CoA dehydrogenase family protein n=1 Tax=Kitasatospora sp. NPDC036755 TaxID=3154600 RepID=UPI0033DCD68F
MVLDGGKRWVTGAVTADHLLVLARHRPGRHFTSFGWVLVPTAAPGVTVRPTGGGLLAGAGIGHVELRQVRLPAAHLVGRPGRGMALFARHMGTERLAGAYWAVALGSRTVAATVELLERRTVEDRPLWQHPAVRQQLAGCLVALRQLSALADTLAERITAGPDLAAAALLKAAVGQGIDPVLDRCAHLQGAEGFAPGGAQLTRAEAGVLGIGGGVTELMLDAVADGAPALLAELRS